MLSAVVYQASPIQLCVLPPQEPSALKELLLRYSVDFSDWGRGPTKPLDSLLAEIRLGESRLQVDASGALWRAVTVVGVDVFFVDPREGMLRLVEDRQEFSSGASRRRSLHTSLAEKQLPRETPDAAARRAIEEELGLPTRGLCIRPKGTGTTEGMSSTYPGLRSRRILTYFECVLPPSLFESDGYVERQEDKVTSFAWQEAS